LLFGDPAMKLKVPLPRRPTRLKALFRSQGGVELSWAAAIDCNDNPVAGYNIYRSTGASDVYTKLNRDIIAQPEYIDGTASATPASNSPDLAATVASGPTYYYVVTSVDNDGDESIQSAMISPSPAETGSGNTSSDEVACFISTTKSSSGSGGVYVVLFLGMIFLFWILDCGFRIKNKKTEGKSI
jgi:fibronectin type 3 domain-containing protein